MSLSKGLFQLSVLTRCAGGTKVLVPLWYIEQEGLRGVKQREALYYSMFGGLKVRGLNVRSRWKDVA